MNAGLAARARGTLAGLSALALAGAALVVIARGATIGTFPIDGAYYVAKALALGETGALRVPWGDGIDAKFLPGLSVLLALPLRWLGLPWGWLLVEAGAVIAAGALTGALAMRLGASPRAAAAAAVAFAADPLVLKWAAVPYAELPALALALGSVELAFRARESLRRAPMELAAAACLGAAAATRLEALLALPLVVAVAASGRRGRARAAAAALAAGVAVLPLGAHVAWPAAHGVAPGALGYVQEFHRNFRPERVAANGLLMLREVAHATPPVSALAGAEVLARGAILALGVLGIARAALGARRLLAAAAVLLAYPWLHAIWYFADGRFMLLVWPLGAALVGVGFDTLLAWAPARIRPAVVAAGLALAATLLAAGERSAHAHALAWERVTGGPADRLARRIDRLVGPRAPGFYEFGGPLVAVYRRAPARFAYALPEFFAADVAPDTLPERVEAGGFVLTRLSLGEWVAARAGDAERRSRFRAALSEPARTVIVAAP